MLSKTFSSESPAKKRENPSWHVTVRRMSDEQAGANWSRRARSVACRRMERKSLGGFWGEALLWRQQGLSPFSKFSRP
jgi:hypothetical protein